MATPIVPGRVAMASGINAKGTTEVTYTGGTLTAATLGSSGTLSASASFTAATLLNPAKTRKSITVSAAADGAGGYCGSDNTVSASTGHYIYPGTQLTIIGYNGPVWAIAPPGAPAQKFYVQEI